ncbi:MAG: MATE family efflux transporter [Immundisolibacter sp.]|uniref:MATE family efflux transporter n=1 Tax=Immundisolibacter sp. TaxID=1934948 RepID=UPI00198D1EB4|nr:MATE family efflux transporter [Immundisolibacter sp.]MBC7162320.1 MATE family efflux transporter [Immundisolibacter sp.]
MTAPRDAAAPAGDALTGAPDYQPGADIGALSRRRRPFIEPERLKRILALALPIIAAMVSQSLLNVVDTAMVGGLGDAALAAVGLGSFVLFTCQAMILGLSVGVQAIAARRKGEGRLDETAVPLNASLLLILIVGPLLTLALCLLAPRFFPLLNPDPAVIAGAVPYFQIRMLAGPLMAMNYAFRGYWNGIDQSRLYMTTLLIMHASNVLLNYLFIYGHFGAPALGVIGSGLGTALSVLLGTAIYYGFGWRYALEGGFLRRRPRRQDYAVLVRISVPAGLQHVSMSAGLVALYWIIGRIGTAELAAANVLINLMTVAILPGMGLAMAAATLVGQALGRGDVADARRWTRDTLRVGMLGLGLLGAPMMLAPDLILGLFLHNPDTVALARWPMRIAGLAVVIEGIKRVYMQVLMSAGEARRVMRVSVLTQWGMFTPLAYLVGPVWGLGLLGIWLGQELYRLTQVAVFRRYWRQGHWARIRI